VAHELRAPIGAAIIHAGLAEMQLRSSDDLERAREAVLTVKQQMMRLDSILMRVLRLSSGEGPDLALRCETVDLAVVFRQVVDQLVPVYPRARQQVTIATRGDIEGRWDASAIAEIVVNIVGNALKFGEERPVALRASARGEQIQIAVRDQGIGIAPRDHRRIFERWERAVPPRSYAGLGLGLWIVRRLVVAHGGSVSVASALGRGATFTVWLPRRPGLHRQ
jgi:signal transduction histidine kinase